MLYDVRVIGYGSFDLQQDMPPKEGDTLDMEGTACTVLSVLPGEWPYDAIIDAERVTDHGMAEVGPVDMEDDGDEGLGARFYVKLAALCLACGIIATIGFLIFWRALYAFGFLGGFLVIGILLLLFAWIYDRRTRSSV